MAVKTPIPLQQVTFLTPSGRVSDPWRQFLLSLADTDGSGGGGDVSALLVLIAELRQTGASQAIAAPQSAHTESDPMALAPSHGTQDDQDLHALATPSTNGFMSASDKAKLDAIVSATGEQIFIEGIDFSGGATSLTLTQSYASKYDVLVHFGPLYQGTDQYDVTGGTTLSVPAGIPAGTGTVYVRPR
ncbi:hypothetical protein [Paraburkholderia caribensis]|uniref:hypothetical protein n=1 Tax=Paraburkholderia caribensis TaxID=75105 RepID=UPI0034D1E003